MLFPLLLTAAISGCSGTTSPGRPAYVLPEDSFVMLLADFALAESAPAINISNVKGHQTDSVYAFDPLSEHGISKARYDSTINFFARDPEGYKKVYEKVLARLSEMEIMKKGTIADSAAKARNVLRRRR